MKERKKEQISINVILGFLSFRFIDTVYKKVGLVT